MHATGHDAHSLTFGVLRADEQPFGWGHRCWWWRWRHVVAAIVVTAASLYALRN